MDVNSEEALDGEDSMGSLLHGGVQSKLAYLLIREKKVHVFTELTLDVSAFDISKFNLHVKREIEPDIAGYYAVPEIPDGERDLVRVVKVPDLAIEILSPRQSLDYLQRKIGALFAIGVRSAWLVIPGALIMVFSAYRVFKTFDLQAEEVIDDIMDIRLPLKEIFEL